ncbi:helix-turn-helix transcriptional regulator [Kordiimonas sp.]|uniref:helix-turn-helix transcriptional regulator n=1 Tax=Kordiimonas sp. TaxID=1970157 RepID=UPI003B5201A5
MHPDKLIRSREVCELTGISRSYLYALIGSGLFPSPKKIGRASRWLLSDVNQFVDSLDAPTKKEVHRG